MDSKNPTEENKEDNQNKRGYVCTKPLDSKHPLVLSDTINVGPFSFLEERWQKEKPRLPPPVYLSINTITLTKPLEKDAVLKGLSITDNGELKLIDEEILKKQRGIITDVVSRLAKSIAEGRGIVGISLPVRIFEPRSTLERIVDWWAFAPTFMTAAAKATEPVERMKNVISFVMAGLYYSASQLKPFNPLLGETLQGKLDDGTEIYMEHTSHHPPIANFYLVNPEFKISGRYEFYAKLSGNKLYVRQNGPTYAEFKDGSKVRFYLPKIKVKGMIMGERKCYYGGTSTFFDDANGLKAVVKHSAGPKKGNFLTGKKKKRDIFVGKLYSIKPNPNAKLSFKNRKEEDKEMVKYGDLDKQICEINGSFLNNLMFDDKEYWHIDKHKPSRYIPTDDPLPSDVRYREDLIWLKYGDLKNAEAWKVRLEEQQRWDRKFRNGDGDKKK